MTRGLHNLEPYLYHLQYLSLLMTSHLKVKACLPFPVTPYLVLASIQYILFLPPELINTTVGEHSLRLWPADAGLSPSGSQNRQSRPEPLQEECWTHPAGPKQSRGTDPRHVPHRVPPQVSVGQQRSRRGHWRTARQVPAGGGNPLGALWTNPNSVLNTWRFLCSASDVTPTEFCAIGWLLVVSILNTLMITLKKAWNGFMFLF